MSGHGPSILLLLIAALLLGVVGSAQADLYPRPRDLSQACFGEVVDHCDPRSPERPECLAQHHAEIKSAVCVQWLNMRSICIDHVRRAAEKNTGVCDTTAVTENYRRCIRKTPVEELPSQCRHSDYYRSLFLHKPRKLDVEDL